MGRWKLDDLAQGTGFAQVLGMFVEEILNDEATQHGLAVLGIAPANEGDGLAPSVRSIALLGPSGPRFWEVFSESSEASDGVPDPMDRWSARILGELAQKLGATPLFPFGGPPFNPFYSRALRSGRFWPSPVKLLVHDRMGLMCSFRGAMGLEQVVPVITTDRPCEACSARPCLSACPAGVLGAGGYDVEGCHSWLKSPDGGDCHQNGCKVRLSCPVGGREVQPAAQSAFHMQSFHPL